MTMFGFECAPLYLFVDLAEFWLQSQCTRVFSQFHLGTKVEFVCLGTWLVIKKGWKNCQASIMHKERILGNCSSNRRRGWGASQTGLQENWEVKPAKQLSLHQVSHTPTP